MKLILLALGLSLSSFFVFSQNTDQVVDDFARNYKGNSKDVQVLTENLTGRFKSEQEKARAIFTWIAENIKYDYNELIHPKRHNVSYHNKEEKARKIAEIKEQNIISTLRRRSGVCHDYSNLFDRMCKIAGIQESIVEGDTRADPKLAGLNFFAKIKHQWNAVCFDNKWYIVDVTWGAGNMNESKKKFIKLFKEEYYLIPPEVSIMDHFPKESKYQYLRQPKSKEEVFRFPVIGYGFLKYRVTDYFPQEAIILSAGKSNEQIKLKLAADFKDRFILVENNKLTNLELKKNDNGYYVTDYNLKGKANKILTIAAVSGKDYIPVVTYRIK